MVFDQSHIGRAPIVADSHNVASGVVVKVIHHTTIAVVMNLVVAPIVFGAEVDVKGINGSNAPEVACDDIAAQDNFVIFVHAIDADAATTVHRVVFKVIVNELVSLDDGRNSQSLLVIAVTAIDDTVVSQQHFG